LTKFLALHETLEVHEILTFKNLCLTKATTMSGLVQDEELKAILSDDVATGTKFIKHLQCYLSDRSNQS